MISHVGLQGKRLSFWEMFLGLVYFSPACYKILGAWSGSLLNFPIPLIPPLTVLKIPYFLWGSKHVPLLWRSPSFPPLPVLAVRPACLLSFASKFQTACNICHMITKGTCSYMIAPSSSVWIQFRWAKETWFALGRGVPAGGNPLPFSWLEMLLGGIFAQGLHMDLMHDREKIFKLPQVWP